MSSSRCPSSTATVWFQRKVKALMWLLFITVGMGAGEGRGWVRDKKETESFRFNSICDRHHRERDENPAEGCQRESIDETALK